MDWQWLPLGIPTTQHLAATPTRMLQRKCACGNATMGGSKCGECSKKERLQTKVEVNEPGDLYEREADRVADKVMSASAHPAAAGFPTSIQRFTERSMAPTDAIPAEVGDVLAHAGAPLAAPVREDMEQRFGHD